MNVLIADKFPEEQQKTLRQAGLKVVSEPNLKGEALVEAIVEHTPEILIVRSTKVPAEAIAAFPGLSLIVRAGAGYDTIDVEAASTRSVFVANCPGMNSIAVAELRNGVWNKAEYSKADGIYGKTLGIIGMGRIGREVAKRAAAFGMEVVAWSRSLTPERRRRWARSHPLLP